MNAMRRVLRAALAIAIPAVLTLAAIAAQPTKLQPAQELIRDVFYNEVQDRSAESFWEYRIEKRTGPSVITSEQIETKQGPIHRMLSKDNLPLTSVQQREENARLDKLLQSPSDQARVQQQYDADEARLQRLTALMPTAFNFDYDGPQTGEVLRLKFVPNPDFKPPTFEARIFHAMAGTLWVNRRQKRMTHLQGEITERVDFGWGLIGHIEKGGTFEIARGPVSATHWKTELVDVHIQGKVILFKTVAQNQHEVRSGFKPVPLDITLQQARTILDRMASDSAIQQTRRAPASH